MQDTFKVPYVRFVPVPRTHQGTISAPNAGKLYIGVHYFWSELGDFGQIWGPEAEMRHPERNFQMESP